MSHLRNAANHYLKLRDQVGGKKALHHTAYLYGVDSRVLLREVQLVEKEAREHPLLHRFKRLLRIS